MQLLGIRDVFTVSIVLYVCIVFSNFAAFPLIETAGRRQLIFGGMIALTVTQLVRLSRSPRHIHVLTKTIDFRRDGYHHEQSGIVGGGGLHLCLVRRIRQTLLLISKQQINYRDRAIIFMFTIGAIGFALGAEVPTTILRPATMSLVGVVQSAGWALTSTTTTLYSRHSDKF